jgi:hypothetical protein
MGSFNLALLEALVCVGVPHERARALVEVLDKAIDERYSLHGQILATRRNVAEIRAKIAETRGQFEARIAESRADVIRWTLAALTEQTALLLGAIRLL